METHLTDAELEAVLTGEDAPRASRHLAACAMCRGQQQALAHLVGGLRTYVDREVTSRPGAFWGAQRALIKRQLRPVAAALPRLAWASVAAMVILGVVLILHPTNPPATSARQNSVPTQATPLENDEMLQLEAYVDTNLPEALAPAGLLAEEMDRAVQKNSNKITPATAKENPYEN